MSYATQTDLESRFGSEELLQLSDHDNLGMVNVAVVAKAIADAEATINGYLRSTYTLPLSGIPDELVRVCCDLARFYLYADRVTDVVQKRRDEAMSWLRDVSAGRISLGLDTQGNAAPVASGGVKFSANDRVFNAKSLDGFS